MLHDKKNKDSLKYEDKEKAEILQHEFSSIFTNEPPGEIPRIQQRCSTNMKVLKITEKDVKIKLSTLNPNKSIGPDDVHAMLLVELAGILAKPLADLFNESMRHGDLPSDWKKAFISSIYKKGSKNLAENYRPISLTSIAGNGIVHS